MGMDGDGMIEVLGPKLKDSIWEVNISLVPSRAQMRALSYWRTGADQFYTAKQEKILFSSN